MSNSSERPSDVPRTSSFQRIVIRELINAVSASFICQQESFHYIGMEGREEGMEEGRKERRKGGRKEGMKERTNERTNERRQEGRKEGKKEGRKEGRKEHVYLTIQYAKTSQSMLGFEKPEVLF